MALDVPAEPENDGLVTDNPPSAPSNPQEDEAILAQPLLLPSEDAADPAATPAVSPPLGVRRNLVRSRRTGKRPKRKKRGVRLYRSKKSSLGLLLGRLCCFAQNKVVRCMNLTARVVLWSTIIALSVGVVWYSYELFHNG